MKDNARMGGGPLLRRRDGVVMVAVLWVCVLVMWMALQIASESRLGGEERVHLMKKNQALYLALGGCYEALGRMGRQLPLHQEDNDGEDDWRPNGLPHLVNYDTGSAVVVVESESRKVNVNKAPAARIREVLEQGGVEDRASETLADAIAGFIAKTDTPGMSGVGQSQQSGHLSSGPFNGPFTSLDQLLLVPGVDRRLFYGESPAKDDSNDSSDSQLSAMPGKHSLFELFTVYGKNINLVEEVDAKSGGSVNPAIWRSGDVYRILSCGIPVGGVPRMVVWLSVRYAPAVDGGFHVLYWKVL